MMKNAVLCALVLVLQQALLCYSFSCAGGGIQPGGNFVSAVGSGISLAWVIDCDHETIIFNATFPVQGSDYWMAAGWNTQSAMPYADVAVMTNYSGVLDFEDRITGNYKAPEIDSGISCKNDLTNTFVITGATTTTFGFTKKWDTNDGTSNSTQPYGSGGKPCDITLTPGTPVALIMAYGKYDNGGAMHQHILHDQTDNLIDLFGGSAPTPAPAADTGGCTSATETFGGGYSIDGWFMNYVIDCSMQAITVTVAAETTSGWVAIGLGDNPNMAPTDVYQADYTNKVVNNRYNPGGHTAPQTQATSLILTSSTTRNATHSSFSFTRKLLATDSQHRSISTGGSQYIKYAYSTQTDDINTEHSNKGAFQLNFYTGATKASTTGNLRLAHGALMTTAWGFLALFGTYISRYLKGIGHLWFQLHAGIQTLVLVITLIAFIIIETSLGGAASSHFSAPNAHNVIGIIVVGLVIVQVILGVLADKLYTPGRSGTPVFPDKLHWILGASMQLLAIVNIFLGFQRYGSMPVVYILFAIWILAMIIIYVYGQMKKSEDAHAASGKDIKARFGLFVGVGVGVVFYAVVIGVLAGTKIGTPV